MTPQFHRLHSNLSLFLSLSLHIHFFIAFSDRKNAAYESFSFDQIAS